MASGLELVLPDEATLLPLTAGLRLGWIASPVPVRWATAAAAEAAAGAEATIALASPMAYARLAATHVVIGDVAVTSEPRGAVALATEQRPDELGDVEIDARDASPAAEALASILRALHFGAGGWWRMTREPAPGAAARLAEGDAALPLLTAAEQAATDAARAEVAAQRAAADAPADEAAEREAPARPGGYVEDLARAWFVLTGLPWVSHLLLVPQAVALDQPAELAAIVGALRDSLQHGREQEAAVVAEAAARLGLPTRALRDFFRMRRYQLSEREQQALAAFYQRATRYAGLAAAPELRIISASTQQGG